MTLADDLDLPAFLRREKVPAASPEPLPVEKVTYAMPPAPSRPSAHERDHRARLVAMAVKEGRTLSPRSTPPSPTSSPTTSASRSGAPAASA
jgi:hypothetical protein